MAVRSSQICSGAYVKYTDSETCSQQAGVVQKIPQDKQRGGVHRILDGNQAQAPILTPLTLCNTGPQFPCL
jgi:hypothetical protein